MIARELISNSIPSLKTTDTGDKGLIWMHELNISQLPVLKNDKFLGLLSEEDIMDFNDPTGSIESNNPKLPGPFISEKAHVYEVIKLASELNLSLIPVVDDEEKYVGSITAENIIHFFATLSSINDSGGIIVLELNKNDYSLSEISRLVESNNASVLSSYVSAHRDSMKLEVTLKVNVSDPKQIIATFERFDYTVARSYQESQYMGDLKDRYDSLMSYLNV